MKQISFYDSKVTDRHTHTQNDYRNPHVPRVDNISYYTDSQLAIASLVKNIKLAYKNTHAARKSVAGSNPGSLLCPTKESLCSRLYRKSGELLLVIINVLHAATQFQAVSVVA